MDLAKCNTEVMMNEDVFNTSVRKFLKRLGVTAQREIEKAVRQGLIDARRSPQCRLSFDVAAISPQHQPAPGIREQPKPKADKDRKLIIEPHFAGRKSLL